METVFQGHTKIALTVKLGHETSLAQISRRISILIVIVLATFHPYTSNFNSRPL